MDSADYKHVVLGLIFLKYVSDNFMMRLDELATFAANLHPRQQNTSPTQYQTR
jgi:type I restriction-modification system DNA methylase subunit